MKCSSAFPPAVELQAPSWPFGFLGSQGRFSPGEGDARSIQSSLAPRGIRDRGGTPPARAAQMQKCWPREEGQFCLICKLKPRAGRQAPLWPFSVPLCRVSSPPFPPSIMHLQEGSESCRFRGCHCQHQVTLMPSAAISASPCLHGHPRGLRHCCPFAVSPRPRGW